MAERIVSPGVFTKEKDQSFLSQGVREIGPAIVGTTLKGPALIPTTVNQSEFNATFGGYTEDSYLPIAANEYFENAQGGVMTVTRLLHKGGYRLKNGVLCVIAESGSASYVTHVLHPAQTVNYVAATAATDDVFEKSKIVSGESGSFRLLLSGSYSIDSTVPGYTGYDIPIVNGTAGYISMSIQTSDYTDELGNIVPPIGEIFDETYKTTKYPAYIQYKNPLGFNLFSNPGHVTMSLGILPDSQNLTNYNVATTPWITSQKNNDIVSNLFRFHTLSHGTAENYDIKIAVTNIVPGTDNGDPDGYASFTVIVRKVNQTLLPNSPFRNEDQALVDSDDGTQVILEQFNNLNLNPDSVNYIAKKIGTQYRTIDSDGKITDNGDYKNNSAYIRVEVPTSVEKKTINSVNLPFGYANLVSPLQQSGSALEGKNLEKPIFKINQSDSLGNFNENFLFGFDYTDAHNLNYLAPLPTSGSTIGSGSEAFYLGDMNQDSGADFGTMPSGDTPYTASLGAALVAGTFASNIKISSRQFVVPFQGGFDGARPNLPKLSGENIKSTNTFGFDCSTADTAGTAVYKQAFNALSNTDYFDINMLLTPGILHSQHPSVTSLARNLALRRQDTFYVMDTNALTENILTTTNNVNSLNSNYTATYYPWLKRFDGSNKDIWLPPSVLVIGALAKNDRLKSPWYAPAGLNRGGLSTVIQAYDNLSQADRDELYIARVNPIATFPNQGVCVWGQKTLQDRPSALDRVNVRRLLITVKKFISSATRFLVFEQNTTATRNRFLSIVNPYLEKVKQEQGLTAFRVVMDGTNNTPDLIDQNILYGQIFLQPTRTAEFILLDFNIQPTGAAFPE
jgi:hypothetical protein